MSLAAWAHSKDPAVDDAKQKLAAIPMSETGHGAQVPFPFANKNEIKSKFSNREINHAIRKASVTKISLKGLHSIQHSVHPKHVEEYIDHPNLIPKGQQHASAKVPVDHPTVIEYGGKRYLWDGNHRLTAKVLLGERDADVRLVKLDKQ